MTNIADEHLSVSGQERHLRSSVPICPPLLLRPVCDAWRSVTVWRQVTWCCRPVCSAAASRSWCWTPSSGSVVEAHALSSIMTRWTTWTVSWMDINSSSLLTWWVDLSISACGNMTWLTFFLLRMSNVSWTSAGSLTLSKKHKIQPWLDVAWWISHLQIYDCYHIHQRGCDSPELQTMLLDGGKVQLMWCDSSFFISCKTIPCLPHNRDCKQRKVFNTSNFAVFA